MRSRESVQAVPINAEAKGGSHSLAGRLIRRAARGAPPSLSERLEEEWLADLAAQRGSLARCWFALGCCWATHVIVAEHRALSASVATSPTGRKTMTLHAQHETSFLPARTSALFIVIGLHVLAIYALASGLASKIIHPIFVTPIQTTFSDEARHADPPPPLPPPGGFSHPQTQEPEIYLHIPATEVSAEITNTCMLVSACAPEPPQPAAQPPVVRVQGGPGQGFPNTDDYYPQSAIREDKQGDVGVRVCVDDKGRLTGNPTLAQSSGIASIDGGALRLAKAASGHYRPTTENGQPVSSCYPFLIRFQLRN
jgi:protein TonB